MLFTFFFLKRFRSALLNNASWSGGAGGKEIRGLGFRGEGGGRKGASNLHVAVRKKRGLKLACGTEEEKANLHVALGRRLRSEHTTQSHQTLGGWVIAASTHYRFRYYVLARGTQHATCITQHATRNTQHASRSTQHATRNTQHATRNTQHALAGGTRRALVPFSARAPPDPFPATLPGP